jgi:hypothetical protein
MRVRGYDEGLFDLDACRGEQGKRPFSMQIASTLFIQSALSP